MSERTRWALIAFICASLGLLIGFVAGETAARGEL